jgi:hypothetical protein
MNQLEFKFFWPLTEQIPLDLDYSNCERPKLTMDGTGISIGNTTGFYLATGTTTVTPFLRIENENLTVAFSKKQPWYRKWIYKLLGIKMETR